MTMLTGRPNNFVRIPESQYQSDIAAAEERGRAAAAQSSPAVVSQSQPNPTQPKPTAPTPEQEKAMTELKVLQNAAINRNAQAAAESEADPKAIGGQLVEYQAAEKAKGRKISLSQAAHELNKK